MKSNNNQTYKEILGTIGQQLKKRQGLIARRVAVISLPLIVSAITLIYSGKIGDDLNLSGETVTTIVIVGFVCTLLSLPWAAIMGHVFKIERIIWIDSFFDEVTLSNKDSWKMAKRLFWPSVWLDILVFLKYYLLAILLSIGMIILYISLIAVKSISFQPWVFLAIIVTLLVAITIYAYVIKIRLRYLPYLFIDTYGTSTFSYGSLFRDAKELNQVMKSDEFKKMLIVVLGAEVVEQAVGVVLGAMNGATSRLSGTAQAAGAAAGMYASEVVAVNKSYAQQVTFYVFYRLAREILFDQPQTINSGLYASVGKETPRTSTGK